MNILTAQQVREWDQYTMEHEPVSSVDLMERAAKKCTEWILLQFSPGTHFNIFCGKGNNGGDGMAIARMLLQNGFPVSVYVFENGKRASTDFQLNLAKLQAVTTDIFLLESGEHFPALSSSDIIIDALLGTGLHHPLEGLASEIVKHINKTNALVISIDMPSGMFADRTSLGYVKVKADHTLTFQTYKTGLLLQENGPYTGHVHLIDIGLHPGFISETPVDHFYVVDRLARTIYKPRKEFAHKGNFGHAMIIAGSYGKIGAAVLAAKACIHTGAGLLTCYLPGCGYEIMQISLLEAMVMTDENENILSQLPGDIEKYHAIGIGPGIGTADDTQNLISFICRRYRKPLVIYADGLNCLSLQKDLLHQLPPYSILTPHPKEFDRLFGDHHSDFDRKDTALKKSKEHSIIIVLKGHRSLITTPEGLSFFNSTGNAGMAKGGSGDVLTGMITSLLAQQYPPARAAILGVYLHGLAGDFAAHKFSREAMTPTGMIGCLSEAFLQLKG